MRRNPYVAAFEITPESIAATSGGDSRYVSGSQPWKGQIGALTANAAAKPRKIHVLPLWPISCMSKVPAESPSAITETSIRSEPASV
jgi:hypothetical protein